MTILKRSGGRPPADQLTNVNLFGLTKTQQRQFPEVYISYMAALSRTAGGRRISLAVPLPDSKSVRENRKNQPNRKPGHLGRASRRRSFPPF